MELSGTAYIPCHLGLKRLDPSRQQITDPTATICLSNEKRKCQLQSLKRRLGQRSILAVVYIISSLGFLCQERPRLRQKRAKRSVRPQCL